ncbi:MAG: hypothetical protein GXY50_02235 [Syntrophomonadaceae bacterium]|nr:hypothetical protein [Syntrophomonadaceae bacterium]
MGVFEELFTMNTASDDRIYSVTTALVKENWNKDYPGMVKVEMFLGETGKNVTGWVPVMSMYGGKNYGYYSLPEVGSEVVVAFNMGDRNCPIIIGTLWNNNNTLPPETATEKNLIKRFKTKGGCEVVFNDEEKKQTIEIKTPAGLGLTIEDEAQSITLHDSAGKNGITINEKDGIVNIKADKKIALSVGGSDVVILDGSGKSATIKTNNIKLEAAQNLEFKGQSTKAEGSMIQVKAQGSMELSASGMTQVKGSMVKIN